ncbi:MAG: histidine phosphatase family protein, partial [Lentisphaeria bacterium]|nr:histidine phosphatase family protein [Lentisphaeria bacterium]
NQKLILEPGIQEVATFPTPTPPGMSFAKIESYFPGLTVPGKRFVDQWRLCNESHPQRYERVSKALDVILAEEKGDILLVGHGGSVNCLVKALNHKRISPKVKKIDGITWNCSLYIFELDDQNRVTGGRYTTSFMADRDVTNNFRCPKIERPDEPRYMTRAQDKADRAKRAKAALGKTSGKTTEKTGTANAQKNEVK